MLYDNQLHHTAGSKDKEVVVYKECFYDLFADYFRADTGERVNYWDWGAGHTSYDKHFFTKEFSHWEDFNFYNEKIDGCNVPEPTVSSFIVAGALVLAACKRRLK